MSRGEVIEQKEIAIFMRIAGYILGKGRSVEQQKADNRDDE